MSRTLSATKIPASLKGMHRAAYLIGRIAMAWGRIEQCIYYDIVRFTNHVSDKPLAPHELEIAEQFKRRIRQWKSIARKISPNNMVRALSAFKTIVRVSPIRHNLMHGYPLYFPVPEKTFQKYADNPHISPGPFIEMADHPTAVKRVKEAIRKINAGKADRILVADLYIRYTLPELENKWRELEKAGADLLAASDGILLRFRPPKFKKATRKK